MMPHPLLADTFELATEYLHPVLKPAGRLIVPTHFDLAASVAAFGWQRNKLRFGETFSDHTDFRMVEQFTAASACRRAVCYLKYILALVADL